MSINPPLVSADSTNPTRDIDVAAGSSGNAGMIPMALAAPMAKRLDETWTAGGTVGASAGGCDSGSKGPNETWNVFLIGAVFSAAVWRPDVQSIGRSSNVAIVTIPGHPLGVGGTIVIGGTNGGFAGFNGAAPISAVTDDTIEFSNAGADFAAEALATFGQWGLPTIAGFDVIASQSEQPAMPAGFTLVAPLAVVTTDGDGNIATVTNVAG